MGSEAGLVTGWRRWLVPPASITDVAERRSLELVAFLLLLLTICSVVATALAVLLAPAWVAARLPFLLALLASHVVLFALTRTRYHRVAATVFCLAPLWSNFAVGLDAPDDPIWFAFVPSGAILAGAILRLRTALAIGAIGVAGSAAVVTIGHATFGPTRGVLVVGFVFVTSAVVLGMARFRNRVEQARLAEVERLARQLAATERLESVGRFAGGVAHDFNNLLTVILANAELARRGLGGPAVLDEIEEAANRAAALTRQLLAFTRNRAIAPTTIRLDDLIRTMSPLLRRLVPENIELELELGATWAVEVDESQLHQVLLNLAANARDAMPEGGRLCFSTSHVTATAAAGERVRLAVTDTGKGMDATTRARAFEPFFTTKPIGQGTGLGLASVHGIVCQSNGTIELASAPGTGTTVTITLPRSRAQPRTAAAGDLARTPRRTTGVALLVEDEPHVRSATERILRDLGLTVVVAASPAEVPRALGEAPRPIDLVVSDIVMPGQSGLALAAELRASHPGLAVVLMSGYAEEDVGAAADWPDTRFLAKPFTAAALTSAVSELLAERTPRASTG